MSTRRQRDRLAQLHLKGKGFDPGPIDGLWGPKSEGAFERYLEKQNTGAGRIRPGSQFSQTFKRSPNQGGIIIPEAVVFHHSAGTWAGDKSWITNPASRVSYHVIINLDGERVEFVKPGNRAWHAGRSRFLGRSGCNGFSLGVAFTGNTNTGQYRRKGKALTRAEIASAIDYLRPLVKHYDIPLKNMTHHRIVSPGRKTDLRPATWDQLRKALAKEFA